MSTASAHAAEPSTGEQGDLLFGYSASLFRGGLALVTFEQIRPFAVQLSDIFFLFSLVFLLCSPKPRLLRQRGCGIWAAGAVILSGATLSLFAASSLSGAIGPYTRLVILFGLIAPLALVHSQDVLKNMSFVLGGILANCAITLIEASVFPGVVAMLSINPARPDITADIGRYQGLTSHPNVLGLSAALAVLIGLGMLTFEKTRPIRGRLIFAVFVCMLGALLSGSRTFLAALVPGVIVFALLEKRHRRAIVRALAVLVVVSMVIMYVVPEVLSEYVQRLDVSGVENAPDYGRLMSAAKAIVEISEKPILGWGVDHFGEAGVIVIPWTGEVLGTHDTFLAYWHSAGLFGGIGFLALFAVPGRRMLRIAKKNVADETKNVLHLAVACFVLLFVVSNLAPIMYNRFLYVPMFILAGFAADLQDPVQKQQSAPA
jgi:hypothetical protein